MADYELTAAADDDLLGIARYTIDTWGIEQARHYEALLEKHFKAIGRGDVQARLVLEHRADLLFSRCEHHYVFLIRRENAVPLILAVFHERMDLINRLRDRLDAAGDEQT
ncbi:MAG: type II toxin-antitoxin system RelE/ParE family toxin [Phycisphaerales bacterium]|nr:type II toxin-antitoxin system RelE/ParE family toxin [Phycisphaerales bacterium]MCB9864316.1 type II toxin-antitoxin system RelE/ParE family toxin [Phycisphaerales bacterium]